MYPYKSKRINGIKIEEHRHIMQLHLGRKLSFNEVVHHIDGNKRNNNLSNLEVMTRSEHIKHHIKNGDIVSKPMSKDKRKRVALNISKLKPCEVILIKHSDIKPKELIKMFGVSKWCISRIRLGKSFVN